MEPRSSPSPHVVLPRPDGPSHGPKARPDPWPLRLAFGAGGIAAVSALLTAIVAPPSPAVRPQPAAGTNTRGGTSETPGSISVARPVRYVQLAPGQFPPPGATVIDAKAPKPITIVTRVAAPAQQTVVVRTTQSGTVLP